MCSSMAPLEVANDRACVWSWRHCGWPRFTCVFQNLSSMGARVFDRAVSCGPKRAQEVVAFRVRVCDVVFESVVCFDSAFSCGAKRWLRIACLFMM